MSSTAAFILAMIALVFIIVLFIVDAVRGNLNIKAKTVGDGQYGTARWATQKEISETYQVIPFEPRKWRHGKELPIGWKAVRYSGMREQEDMSGR